ncbi:hypothetical protein JCGZ_04183 [Jatropha curcas]|uniref:OTU domain-containing protein n=1 Tax=Jatropha curcas TaxID=180498 RepID=A0A067KXZ7_JATCU|nr:hypothetical protein JCGZ_04183 [Jatropha curcas]
MTRVLVQRGSGSSSSSQSRAGSSSTARPETQVAATPQIISAPKDEEIGDERQELVVDEFLEYCGSSDKATKSDEFFMEGLHGDKIENLNDEIVDNEKLINVERIGSGDLIKGLDGLRILEGPAAETEGSSGSSPGIGSGSPHPPPPPVPPPKPLSSNSNSNSNSNLRRTVTGSSNSVRIGSSRRAVAWPVVSTRTSPSGSRPSSPRSHGDSEGYNSADEQNPCCVSSYDDLERERQFEIDIRRSKGFEVRRMLGDGNCLFRAVADQVYGDSEAYDLIRQMCIDYMVYGNNVEIQALSEMYNRPIHIYSYSTEPINIFHGSYNTDTPPIRLSYHHGNHYNSLLDPRRLTIGAGLGFSCLRGTNVDKDQVKAAIKAQQDQQIDNATEGRFYSDLELTEKEIERMVMEASRAEYIANDKFKQQLGHKESTSGAEPSSSGARSSGSENKGMKEHGSQDAVLSSSMQMVLSMGFSYLQVIEAYSIFGDDVDSMVCYLLETGTGSSRRKGKATE